MENKEKGSDTTDKKRGRPTEARKNHDIKVRVADDLHDKLVKYAAEHSTTKAETIRRALVDFFRN